MLSSMHSRLTTLLLALLLTGCGGGGNSGGGGGGGGNPPGAPTGLTITNGDTQVALSWNASAGATSYHVKRSSTQGGPYTQIAAPTATSFTNTGLTNGNTYYYVVSAVNSNGESANSSEKTGQPAPPAPPVPPTGLTATAGDKQVALSWTASTGATGYHVKRSGTTGGPYTQVGAPTNTNFTDTGLTNGTPYYYVVTALNNGGESGDSSEKSATPNVVVTAHVTVDVLANRHAISPYVYGGNFASSTSVISDSGTSVVRWGGNASTRYNWINFNTNAAADWYFINRPMDSSNGLYQDSTNFVTQVRNANSSPLMTIGMLDWVAKDATSYSFSVAKYGSQCKASPYNSDQGNGVKADCATNVTGNDLHDAHVPLLDSPQAGDPPGSVYRNQWAAALATAFGSKPHFYDMDNEIDIWNGTHRDVHPSPAGYEELRDVYLRVARGLKAWDPAAIRLGPVSCCWWYYWNGADGNDKGAHGGVDFLPWWLNEIYWQDQIVGTRSLDVFDIHAYPDGPDTTGWATAQKQALAARIYRDYWDPTYTTESWFNNNTGVTHIEPNPYKPFRIPRMRAIVNSTYPDTPLAFTEWSASFAGESDFSTALGDADAYGIMGRERMYLATRWGAPDPANPNYQALKIYTNYDGAHHGFATTSVTATHDADPNLFGSFASVNVNGSAASVVLINKDPANAQNVQVTMNGYTPTVVRTYTLSSTTPNSIVAAGPVSWPTDSVFTLPPYSITLLAINGSMPKIPVAEWDLNPDVIMVPAGGTVTLSPTMSGSGTVTLSSPQSDVGITMNLTDPNLTTSHNGTITVNAGATPGFYHFTVTGTDGTGVAQPQSGWVLVGNPAATLTKTGDNQSGQHGTTLNLMATIAAGSSGGSNTGASIFFTTDAGSLSSRIVKTNASGQATITLTLPNNAAMVHVTAEGPIALGHPVVTFTETSQ